MSNDLVLSNYGTSNIPVFKWNINNLNARSAYNDFDNNNAEVSNKRKSEFDTGSSIPMIPIGKGLNSL